MSFFSFGPLKRQITMWLSLLPATSFAHCDFYCGPDTDTPLGVTQFSGTVSLLLTLSPFTATQEASADDKYVYTSQQQEAVHFYLASDGAIEDAYFTSAMERFGKDFPDSRLSKLAAAELISSYPQVLK